MRIVTGNVVTGENFFQARQPDVQRLREQLAISDVLLVGPRRTGKTSLLKEYLLQQEETNPQFKSIFIDLESTKNLYEFYVKIIREILRVTRKWRLYLTQTDELIKRFSTQLSEIFESKIDISAILGLPSETPVTISFPKFEPKKITELQQKLSEILHALSEPLVIVLDEFPELIWRLGQDAVLEQRVQIRKEQTEFMLSGLRTLRQESTGQGAKHKIVIAGSVNLVSTLEHLGLSDAINDIVRLELADLTAPQAIQLFEELAQSEQFKFNPPKIYEAFIAKQFGSTSPLYIQMFAQLFVQLRIDRGGDLEFSEDDLITSYKNLISTSGGQGPRYLRTRIERYYTAEEQKLVLPILEIVAKNQFQNKTKTSESDCLSYAQNKAAVEMPRLQQTDLLAKMKSDDLIHISTDQYWFESQFLCNFWHYTLVGTEFLA